MITVLTSLLFFYPTILQSTMSLFVCKTLDPPGGLQQLYKVSAAQHHAHVADSRPAAVQNEPGMAWHGMA
jgi:hypothetical protein